MWLHLADTSSDRGQYGTLLAAAPASATLASYHYLREKPTRDAFARLWGEQVRLHLVQDFAANAGLQAQALDGSGEAERLMSYMGGGAAEKLHRKRLMEDGVNLHLVGWPGVQKPQGAALEAETPGSHLLGYPTADRETPGYERVWAKETAEAQAERQAERQAEAEKRGSEDNTKVHLTSTHGGPEVPAAMNGEGQADTLASYAYRETHERWLGENWKRADLRPRVIIDSGAFTAWSTGKAIRPEDYVEWALAFRERWESKMAALHFINLDVIGDQEKTWANFERIRAMGLPVLPVVTHDAPKRDLERALEHPYVCLGGLVPLSNQRERLRAWLDKCFGLILRRRAETGVMPRVHLLGVGQKWVIERYPCYSTDTSSWVRSLRFGRTDVMGPLKRLPRYTAGAGELAATLQTLRAEIRKLKTIEKEATSLWTSRGIVWDD